MCPRLGSTPRAISWCGNTPRQHDCIMVTKDADFGELGLLRGFPPCVAWIRRGNCSTCDIAELLRVNRDGIASLSDKPLTGVLTLF